MVDRVESFKAGFQSVTFMETERPADRCVEVDTSRSVKSRSPQVAKRSVRIGIVRNVESIKEVRTDLGALGPDADGSGYLESLLMS